MSLGADDLRDTQRDAYGVLLSHLRDDLALLGELLGRYELGQREQALVLFVLGVAEAGRDRDDFCDLVYELALAGAGQPAPADHEPARDNTPAPPLATLTEGLEEPGERAARALGHLEGRRLLRVDAALGAVELVFEASGERGERNLVTVYSSGDRRLDVGSVDLALYGLETCP